MKTEKTKPDIYKDNNTLKTELKLLKDNKGISNDDRKLIQIFIDEYCDGLSDIRKVKYIIRLMRFAEYLKKKKVTYQTVTKADINQLRKYIERMPAYMYNKKKKKWIKYKEVCSPTTITDNKLHLKIFYRWLEHYSNTPEKERLTGRELRQYLRIQSYPEVVKDIITTYPKPKQYKANEMLTWEDVVNISQQTDCHRNKALIQLLGESGCRIGEILTLTVDCIEFKNLNGKSVGLIHLKHSKTKVRSIGVVDCVPALREYIRRHPFKDHKPSQTPLFVKYGYNHHDAGDTPEYMTYNSVRRMIKWCSKRAGIEKNSNAHFFRKSRASNLLSALSEQEAKSYLGWVQDSQMLRVYSFIDQEKSNKKYWKSRGIDIEDEKETKKIEISPITCPHCEYVNPCGEKLCLGCHQPIDNALNEVDRLRELMREELKKLGLSPS